jgi:hypothetical protein
MGCRRAAFLVGFTLFRIGPRVNATVPTMSSELAIAQMERAKGFAVWRWAVWWIILALVRQPGFAASGAFIRWNVLGILDLIIAISIGTVSAVLATGGPGEISTAPTGARLG